MDAPDDTAFVLGHRLPPQDRMGLALYHIAQGDSETAYEAMVDPNRLSPRQQRTLQQEFQKYAFGEEVEEGGLTGAIKRVITDPAVLFGFTLSAVFPFGKTAVRRFLGEAATYERTLGPISRRIAPGMEVLRDRQGRTTRLGKQLRAVESRIEAGREEMRTLVGRAFSQYERVTGGAPTPESAVRIQLSLEQPWNPKSPAYKQWDRLRAQTGSNIGVRPIALTPAERIIFDALDTARRKYKTTVVDALGSDKELVRELQSRGILDERGPTAVPVEFYAPRYLWVSPSRVRAGVTDALRREDIETAVALSNPASPTRLASYRQYLAAGVADSLPGSLKRRSYELLPSPEHLKLAERNLVPGTIEKLQQVLAGKYRGFDTRKAWGEYSLDATRVWPQYFDAMTRFEAWTVSGYGKAINAELEKVQAQNPWLASYSKEVLIPTIRGRMTFHEYTKAQLWEGRKLQWVKTLQQPVFQSTAAKPIADWITESLIGSGRLSSRAGIDAAVAGYLYQSALGANIGSSFKNLMQTVSTTLPTLGPKATLVGIKNTLGRLAKWGNLRLGGMDADEAYAKVFRPYIESGIHLSPDFGDVSFRRLVEESWQQASRNPRMARAMETGKWALMLPFRSAETFNRMVAFEGAMHLGRREGLVAADAVKFAREIVEETQFLGGALMTPTGIAGLSPTQRMFMTFPLRMANFLRQAVTRGEVGKLGALFGATAALGDVGESFGLDVSRSTVASGLPLPREPGSNLFGALPLVPPIYQLEGGLAYGLFSGDWSYFKRAAPMLAPGGLAVARAAGTLSPTAAAVLDKRYADYNHPDAAGRIPLLKANGQLIGYYSPLQIAMLASGLEPSDVTAEQNFANYYKVQAQQINALRRQYMEGMANNDTWAMQTASEHFKMLYGKELTVKPSDIKALQDRRTITRMQLLVRQLPQEVRPEFQQMAQAAIAERMGSYGAGGVPYDFSDMTSTIGGE